MFNFLSTLKHTLQETQLSHHPIRRQQSQVAEGSREDEDYLRNKNLSKPLNYTKTQWTILEDQNMTMNKDFGSLIYRVKMRWSIGCDTVLQRAFFLCIKSKISKYHWVPNKESKITTIIDEFCLVRFELNYMNQSIAL